MSDSQGIAARKRSGPGGWIVWEVGETGSTNTDLMEAVADGRATDRTALRADHQSAGRGRLDRRWDAPTGVNLLTSLLFTDPPDSPVLLTQAVGLAAVTAVESVVGARTDRLGLKWPNDVLVDGVKLAGVLAQRSPQTGAVVVGIGLNLAWAPPGAASVADAFGCVVEPTVFLDALLDAVDGHLVDIHGTAAYRERLLTLGNVVRLELPGGHSLVGTAVDIDEGGRLLVDDGNVTLAYDVADVVHLRPA